MRKARSASRSGGGDVDKGDRDNMVILSRLVGRVSVEDPFMQGTFEATPPLESLMFFTGLRPADATMDGSWTSSLLVLDVSRARSPTTSSTRAVHHPAG